MKTLKYSKKTDSARIFCRTIVYSTKKESVQPETYMGLGKMLIDVELVFCCIYGKEKYQCGTN